MVTLRTKIQVLFVYHHVLYIEESEEREEVGVTLARARNYTAGRNQSTSSSLRHKDRLALLY